MSQDMGGRYTANPLGITMNKTEVTLLPCPFCGGKPHENRKTGLVRCDNPKCGVQTLALADHYWNTRQSSSSTTQDIGADPANPSSTIGEDDVLSALSEAAVTLLAVRASALSTEWASSGPHFYDLCGQAVRKTNAVLHSIKGGGR